MTSLQQLFAQAPQSGDMQPSTTTIPPGTISLRDLQSNTAGNLPEYMRMMQYLTQPRVDMGPEARRAIAGMPAGPRYDEPIEMQPAPRGSSLMAMLFGGAR